MQVSKESYEELKEKIKFLKTVRRQEISKAIGEAREHGDLRENSAYHEARKEQSLNEARIVELEATLASARVVDQKNLVKDRVVLGANVKIEDVDSKEVFEYKLVSELEADIFENKISLDSPVGSALFNHKKNDTVEIEIPRGTVTYKIMDIY